MSSVNILIHDTHRLNVKFLIVKGKLYPKWDWGILFQKGVHHAMRTPKTGGACTDVTPTLYRRDADREKPPP